MPQKVRLGPAGNPINYKGSSVGAPEYIRKEGLNAYEYEAVRGVRISEESAKELGKNAKKHDIWVTTHASYFINFSSSKKETIEKSKDRLFKAARIGALMGAHQVVFHPGYYSGRSKEESLKITIQGIREVVERLKQEGIKILIGPETTGKKSQVGSLEETIKICQEIEMTAPTVDFAHLHARSTGKMFENKDDYLRVFRLIEEKLGSEIAKNLHTHFSEIEYTEKGERKHLDLGTKNEPPFIPLAEVIIENGYTPTIICETPLLDLDALKMKKVLEKLGYVF